MFPKDVGAEALEGADSKELGRAFQALVGEMLES